MKWKEEWQAHWLASSIWTALVMELILANLLLEAQFFPGIHANHMTPVEAKFLLTVVGEIPFIFCMAFAAELFACSRRRAAREREKAANALNT